MSKQAVYELLSRYAAMRNQHVESFLKEAVELIQGSQVVPWHGRKFDTDYAFFSRKVVGNLYRINSPAAKAYLWLLIQQEESIPKHRDQIPVLRIAKLAQGLGVSRTTAAKLPSAIAGTLGLGARGGGKTGRQSS